MFDANQEVSCVCAGHKGEYVRDPDCSVCNDADDEPAETPACPVCGDETLPLGTLGRRAHFRCRACGAGCSVRVA